MYRSDPFFDNMEDFFTGNGYEIVDKKTFTPNEITFDNIWGVCDEDMYNKAIKNMNQEAATNKPFALITTYPDLGLIKNNVLTMISTKQRVKQF